MPDKQQAWDDLHRLTNDENAEVRAGVAYALCSSFPRMPDKQQAWDDLHRLIIDKDSQVRYYAAFALGSSFSRVPDEQQAWDDLHRLTNDEDAEVRAGAAYALCFAFYEVLDKQQVWNDLHRLTNDEDARVRSEAASFLSSSIYELPDKRQAWDDLHRLINDEDAQVRSEAAFSLGLAFSEIPDKQQAWNNLIRLAHDEDAQVRSKAAISLGLAFSEIPDKQQAWDDLHRLTNDEDAEVRAGAALALDSAFSHAPDKQQAWDDLHRLINDKNKWVKFQAARSLGYVFSEVPDKQQAWNDLIRLTNDKNSSARASSNHSLGRISIFKASQTNKEEDYKKELEKAICFFEKAAQESSSKKSNPSKFCLPFYRSFYTIIFKKQEAKEEVERYLKEAKAAIVGSESKKQLFEAVENLSNALIEIQNLENLDLQGMKGELNFYRKYCDHAAELMEDTDETAPFATEVLKKGIPILDRNLKRLIEEIKEKARTAYRESIETDAEEAAFAICKQIQRWEIGNQEYLLAQIENLVDLLKSYIPKTRENNMILNRIDTLLLEPDIVKQYMLLTSLIPQIMCIQMSKEVKELRSAVCTLTESIDEMQNQQEYLDKIQRNLENIKNEIPELKGNIDEILYELYDPLSRSQKLKIALPIIPTLVSYEIETNVPKLVADKIDELKNLVLGWKK